MSLSQKKFREIVLQMLYGIDVGQDDPESLIQLLSKELKVSKSVVRQAWERVQKVLEVQEEIDKWIDGASQEYRFERIGVVERNILRLALFEMKDDDIEPKVSISEAIRLTRKFATPESASYVNAILDSIWKGLEDAANS